MKTILVAVFLLFANSLTGQCNCETIKRDDGAEITQCPPIPVSYDNNSQIALSISSNGSNNFLGLSIRFKGEAKKITGKLSIRLTNNYLFSLDITNSQLGYIGGSQMANAIYLLSESNNNQLMQSAIKTISFYFEDEMLRTFEVKANSDTIKRQLICLK